MAFWSSNMAPVPFEAMSESRVWLFQVSVAAGIEPEEARGER